MRRNGSGGKKKNKWLEKQEWKRQIANKQIYLYKKAFYENCKPTFENNTDRQN